MINFIHVWRNKIPENICDDVIKIYENFVSKTPQMFFDGKKQFFDTNLGRSDLSFPLNTDNSLTTKNIMNVIYSGLWECYLIINESMGNCSTAHTAVVI